MYRKWTRHDEDICSSNKCKGHLVTEVHVAFPRVVTSEADSFYCTKFPRIGVSGVLCVFFCQNRGPGSSPTIVSTPPPTHPS